MGDHIIDTNVLLVASARDPESPFKDSAIPAEQQLVVLKWLKDFWADRQRKVVLDQFFKIWEEYNHKMTGQDLGLLVVTEKLQSAVRLVDVVYDEHGHGCLPPELERVVHDRSDRKFVAAALLDFSQGDQSTIVNAVDSDWYDWEETLKGHGIVVKHLIDRIKRHKPRSRAKR